MKLKQITKRVLVYKKDIIVLLVLTVAVILSAKALFQTGFFRTIDDITTVRIMYMVKELVRGEWINNFPIRWSAELSHGYGYPLYLFYGPLTYYVGAFFMMFGKLSHILATKAVYVIPLLYGPYLFYFAARQKVGVFPALVASIFFALYPFRGYDTYYRGGVGEAWAMAFLPGVFAGIFIMDKHKTVGGLLLSLFLALSIFSHNLSGLLILGFVIFYGVVFKLKSINFWKYVALGMGLVCFFWLPAFAYLPIVKVSYSNQNTGQLLNFLYPFRQLIDPAASLFSEKKYQAFLFHLLIIGGIFTGWLYKKKKIKDNYQLLFWGGVGLSIYLLLASFSAVFWKVTMPITRILQFPWRLFILLSFIQPFVTGLIISYLKPRWQIIVSVFIIGLSVFYLQFFQPKEYSYFYEYSAEDTGVCAATWGDEYIPIWVVECPDRKAKMDLVVAKGASITEEHNNGIVLKAKVNSENGTPLTVYKYYFPGWKVLIDGNESPVEYKFAKHGIFRTTVPAGSHTVEVIYSKTPIMWIADIISIASIVLYLFILSRLLLEKTRAIRKHNRK